MPSALSMRPPKPVKGQLKGWHALLWFASFFAFMFVVNGIFLWTAITTFPGEDVEKSYLTGLDYNREIERRAHQAEAGWGAEIGILTRDGQTRLHVRLVQANSGALPAFATTAHLRHPADRALDRVLELVPLGGGEYVASIDGIAPGDWTVQVSADIDPETEGHEFLATRELLVP